MKQAKRIRLFALLLALALLLPLIPMEAHAEYERYHIWVNGAEFTSLNMSTGIKCGDGWATLTLVEESNEGAAYYVNLRNATIDKTTNDACIYSEAPNSVYVLTKGDCTLNGPVGIIVAGRFLELYSGGNGMTPQGSLTINATSPDKPAVLCTGEDSFITVGTVANVIVNSKAACLQAPRIQIDRYTNFHGTSSKNAAIVSTKDDVKFNAYGEVQLKGYTNAVRLEGKDARVEITAFNRYLSVESETGPCVYAENTTGNSVYLNTEYATDFFVVEGYPSGHRYMVRLGSTTNISTVYLQMDEARMVLPSQYTGQDFMDAIKYYCDAKKPGDLVDYNLEGTKLVYAGRNGTYEEASLSKKLDASKEYFLRYDLKPLPGNTFANPNNSESYRESIYLNGKKTTLAVARNDYGVDIAGKPVYSLSVFVPLGKVNTGSYIVTYDANGGTGTMVPIGGLCTPAYHLRECLFTAPEHYRFRGWSLSKDGGDIVYNIPVSHNVAVYAQWEPTAVYSITVGPNPGDGEVVCPKTAIPGEKITAQVNAYPGSYCTGLSISPAVTLKQESYDCWTFTMPESNVVITPSYIESSTMDIYTSEDFYFSWGDKISYRPLNMDAKGSEFKIVEIIEGSLPTGYELRDSMTGTYITGQTFDTESCKAVIRGQRYDDSYDYHTVNFIYYVHADDTSTETFDIALGTNAYLLLHPVHHGEPFSEVMAFKGTGLPEGMRLSWNLDGEVAIVGTPKRPGTYWTYVACTRPDDETDSTIRVEINVLAEEEYITEFKRVKVGERLYWPLKPDAFQFDSITVNAGTLPEGVSLWQNNNGATLRGTPVKGGLYEAEIMFVNSAHTVTYDTVTLQVIAENCGGDPYACPGDVYTDMPKPTNWAHAGIEYVIFHGLMNGTSATTFAPKLAMSRSMLVTVLYRMEGEPGAGKTTFTDVKPTSWYGPAVSWAADLGIVNGVGNGKFNPNGDVTREQLAAILYRYAQYKNYNTTASADISGFADAGKIGKWYTDGVKWAVALELMKGTERGGLTYVDPQGTATREQIAAILMRFCQNVVK